MIMANTETVPGMKIVEVKGAGRTINVLASATFCR